MLIFTHQHYCDIDFLKNIILILKIEYFFENKVYLLFIISYNINFLNPIKYFLINIFIYFMESDGIQYLRWVTLPGGGACGVVMRDVTEEIAARILLISFLFIYFYFLPRKKTFNN